MWEPKSADKLSAQLSTVDLGHPVFARTCRISRSGRTAPWFRISAARA